MTIYYYMGHIEFLLELQGRDKRSILSRLLSPFVTTSRQIYNIADIEKEEEEVRKGVSVSLHLQVVLRDMECRSLLVQHAVNKAIQESTR
jgi:hypothetical protein